MLQALLTATFFVAAQEPPEAIRWCDDLATAKAEAKESGKPVILYFTFDT